MQLESWTVYYLQSVEKNKSVLDELIDDTDEFLR